MTQLQTAFANLLYEHWTGSIFKSQKITINATCSCMSFTVSSHFRLASRSPFRCWQSFSHVSFKAVTIISILHHAFGDGTLLVKL